MYLILFILLLIPQFAHSEIVFMKTGTALKGTLKSLDSNRLILLKNDGTNTTISLEHIQAVLSDELQLLWGEENERISAYRDLKKETNVLDPSTSTKQSESTQIYDNTDHTPKNGIPQKQPVRKGSNERTQSGLFIGLNSSNLNFHPDFGIKPERTHKFIYGLTFHNRISSFFGLRFDAYFLSRGTTNSGRDYIDGYGYANIVEEIELSYFGINPMILLNIKDEINGSSLFHVGKLYLSLPAIT